MISAARPTLLAFLSDYYFAAKPALRPPTVGLYHNTIRLVERYAGRTVFADELCNELVEGFRQWRLAQGRPATTVNKDVRHLLALWRLARKKRLIGDPPQSPPINQHAEPDIQPVPEDLDPLSCWSMEELARILREARLEPDLFMQVAPGSFFSALVLCIYDVGPRITAIMEAAKEDLDWSAGTITLRARSQKHRRGQVIALSLQTLAAIRAMQASEVRGQKSEDGSQKTGEPTLARLTSDLCPLTSGFLFPWPYDRTADGWRALRKRYKKILRRAGLPATRRDLFHRLRRTTATQLYNATGGIEAAQRHLGHSDQKVTQRYIDWSKVDETQRSAQRLPRPEA